MVASHRKLQRCVPHKGTSIRIGTMGKQHFHHGHIAIADGNVQRRNMVSAIRGYSLFQQLFNKGDIVISSGFNEFAYHKKKKNGFPYN